MSSEAVYATRAIPGEIIWCHESPLVMCHPGSLPWNRQALREADAARQRGDTGPGQIAPKPPDDGDEFDEHDRFFAISRSLHNPVITILDAAQTITRRVAEHHGQLQCGAAEDDSVLLSGDRCLLRFGSTPAGPGEICRSFARIPDSSLRNCARPHEHWLLGHQLFFVLIQSITLGLQCFVDAQRRQDLEDCAIALRFSADMCHHSAVAMRYAGVFDPAEYDRSVRPAMTPPTVRLGFSGFQTRDHLHLVRMLRQSRASLQAVGFEDATVRLLQSALGEVYAAHRAVCARFDGTTRPSLLMEANGGELAHTPGVTIIDRLTARRLGSIGA